MTKEYDEYKANKGKGRKTDILIKVLGIVAVVGLVGLALMFCLMLLFPSHYATGDGWLEFFRNT
jgi:flagellar basal body-associated protein FliL